MAKHVLVIAATLTHADGTPFYKESHEWHGIDDDMLAWFDTELREFSDKCSKEASSGTDEDGENLTATFSGSVDGVAQPDDVFTGISYHSLVKMQREWHRVGDSLIKIGEGRVKDKKAKKPKK